MELGIGSYALRWAIGIGEVVPDKPATPADLVYAASQHNVRLVQFADNICLARVSPASLDALSTAVQQTGTRIELGTSGLRSETIAPHLELVGRFDAKLLRVAPDTEDAETDAGRVVARLRQFVPMLEASGVTLAIENHFHFPSPYLRRIIEDVGSSQVGVCLDVANSIAVGEWPSETISILAPFAVSLHLKDYRIAVDPHGVGMRVVGTPLGEGIFDPDTVFDALDKASREVDVILEHWLPFHTALPQTIAREKEWLRRSIAFARHLLDARHRNSKTITGRK